MKRRAILSMLLVLLVEFGPFAEVLSQILVPNYHPSTNSLLSAGIQQEAHLAVSLFAETNKTFDERVYQSVRSEAKPPLVISFHLISFVFFHPTTNDYVGSHSELGQPDELLCTGETISHRKGSSNDIPLNYVRVVDRRRKEVAAELELLVGVASLKSPQDVRYFRRSFRFVYRDGWKEE
jgi:hypothetical protein